MIYFIIEPTLDNSLLLHVTETGKKTQQYSYNSKEKLFERLDLLASIYWKKYVIDKFYLLTHVEIKDRARIITDLTRFSNVNDICKILEFEAIPVLCNEEKTPDLEKHIQECLKWCKSAQNRAKEKAPTVSGFQNHNITFENEENRPSIEQFLQMKR